MGLDVHAADWGANNAIENNFVPSHQLNVDVKEPEPEEERGRKATRDDLEDYNPAQAAQESSLEDFVEEQLTNLKHKRGASLTPNTRNRAVENFSNQYVMLRQFYVNQQVLNPGFEEFEHLASLSLDELKQFRLNEWDPKGTLSGEELTKAEKVIENEHQIRQLQTADLGVGLIAGIAGARGVARVAGARIGGAARAVEPNTPINQNHIAAVEVDVKTNNQAGKGLVNNDILEKGVEKPNRVRPINNRKPINADYANQVYPLEKLPLELRQKYPHSVPFTGTGHPDFARYALKKVEINVTGNNHIDFPLADKAAGFSSRPAGYTWHHHHDGKGMYLVPKDIHKAVRHTGGVAAVKQTKKPNLK